MLDEKKLHDRDRPVLVKELFWTLSRIHEIKEERENAITNRQKSYLRDKLKRYTRHLDLVAYNLEKKADNIKKPTVIDKKFLVSFFSVDPVLFKKFLNDVYFLQAWMRAYSFIIDAGLFREPDFKAMILDKKMHIKYIEYIKKTS